MTLPSANAVWWIGYSTMTVAMVGGSAFLWWAGWHIFAAIVGGMFVLKLATKQLKRA